MRLRVALIFSLISFTSARADIHIIFYATYHGNTGHCGIAIDEYEIHVLEKTQSGKTVYYQDTVKTGAVIYYDFWPLKDVYKGQYDGDVTPIYFKLPSPSYKQMISLKTLMDQGVPHKLGYPCDGIVSLVTSVRADFNLGKYLEGRMRESRSFNSMQYNCCDFVADALRKLTGKEIYAKEFIIKDFVTTPNELYKTLSTWPDIIIHKNPGDKINGTFFRERIWSRIMPVLNAFQLFINIPYTL